MLHLTLLPGGGKKLNAKKGIFTSAAKAEMNYNFYGIPWICLEPRGENKIN